MAPYENSPARPAPIRIALTGGIGAGKSTVAGLFIQQAFPVISLDELGHECLTNSNPEFIAEIEKAVGVPILKEGRISKEKLRNAIFTDATARLAVEKILQPRIWQSFLQEEKGLTKRRYSILIVEAALILEAGIQDEFKEIVVVWAPRELRKKRLMDRPGMTEALAEAILATQLSEEESRSRATHVLENAGEEKDLLAPVTALIAGWKKLGYF